MPIVDRVNTELRMEPEPGAPPDQDPGQALWAPPKADRTSERVCVFHPKMLQENFSPKALVKNMTVLANATDAEIEVVSVQRVATLEVAKKETGMALVKLNGQHGFLTAKAPAKQVMDEITERLETALRAGTLLTSKGQLDLSYLTGRIPDVDFNNMWHVKFVVFYCAVLAEVFGVKVRRLVFVNPDVRHMALALEHVKYQLRHLSVLELAKPMEFPQKLKDAMDRCGIKVLDKTPAPKEVDHPWDHWGWGYTEPPFVALSGYVPSLRIDMFPPVQFDLNEAVTHAVIVEFFRCAWESLDEIGRFYLPQSVFSLTVNGHGPGPLVYFERYSRDVGGIDENRLVGSSDIAKGQSEVFRGHFYAHPTGYQCSRAAPEIVCYTIQGVFQFEPETVLGFDRTMVMVPCDGQWMVSNDHIFIRMPRGT